MVGVPALVRCVCGPSSRTAWPILYAVSLRIMYGPSDERHGERGEAGEHRAQRDVAEDVEQPHVLARATARARAASVPSLGRSAGERGHHALHLHEARSLHQHAAAAHARATSSLRRLSKWRRAGAERLHRLARSPRPARAGCVDALGARVGADLAVKLARLARRLRPCRRAPARAAPGRRRARRSPRAPSPGSRCSVSSISVAPPRACLHLQAPGVRAERREPLRDARRGRFPPHAPPRQPQARCARCARPGIASVA